MHYFMNVLCMFSENIYALTGSGETVVTAQPSEDVTLTCTAPVPVDFVSVTIKLATVSR